MKYIALLIVIISFSVLSGYSQELDSEKLFPENNNKFRVFARMGYSQWYMTKPDSMQYFLYDYLKGLEDNISYEAGAKYYFFSNFTAGVKYSHFYTSNFLDNVGLLDNAGNIAAVGYIEDNVNIGFASLIIGKRFNIFNNICFEININPGMIYFKDQQHVVSYDMLYKGSCPGVELDFMLDFLLSERFSMGLNISYLGGKLKEWELDGVMEELENPEKMDRLNLDFGLSFYF